MSIENLVVLVGLAVGAAALVTACAVWYRKQQFGMGGATLSVVGVVLIGLSIWSGVTFSITADGLQVELDSLEERLAQVAENSSVVSEEVVKLNDAVTQDRGGVTRTFGAALGSEGVTTPDGDPGGGGTGSSSGPATTLPAAEAVDAARLKKSSDQLRALSRVLEKSSV